MQDAYDCIVIGAGPAGCMTSTVVAMAGYRALLLEREKVPRFHIGESLMPEVYWPLQRLGLLEQMKNSSFVKKLSVQFVSDSGKESQPFFFPDHDPHECSRTWQVERSTFDKMLFDNAAAKGVDCLDETRVLDVLFDGDRAFGVRLQMAGGEVRDVHARVVVDATGLQAMLANRLGLKRELPNLKKSAIWGYYRNARRDPGEAGGGTLILHTQEKKSWFWFIPLSNNITSIGVVGDSQYMLKGRGKPAEIFEDELVRCPALSERLLDAELVCDFRVAKEFSYSTTQQAGNGWVMVGDAFGFIDPIYSSGVYLAFRSGELAGDAIIEGLHNDDLSEQQLGKWVADFKVGVNWIYKLVEAFYTNPFSFGEFMRRHPQHKGNLVDILIGRVFQSSAGKIFDDLDPAIAEMVKAAKGNQLAEV